ncbi:D-aminoacyl-tRNA deacylase [bacterium]|nr:D-tyrosyl-tRNA(Tyr) deacylase [bacterium]MCG2676000.1 D-aminoacyl-tRNA deacylase [bacterium]MCG2678094.1 D-aminoacyl-tRNA deacylase [bacterium]
MRAVIQRVKGAKVSVEEKMVGKIGRGMVILLGIGKDDRKEDTKYLADKVSSLRIFEDEKNRMNLSLLDIKGEALVISQFTLYGDTKRGRRPSFIQAAEPKKAEELYEKFISLLKEYNLKVASGVFGAKMLLEIQNDGPVTLILDSNKN